ncbi:MAG TPA: DUF167 family protein [Chloroflexota bacterium]
MRYAVRVHPRASRERVTLVGAAALEVWITAAAAEGRANAALLALLAASLGLRPRDVTLVRGHHSRQKVVDLPLDLASVQRALGEP